MTNQSIHIYTALVPVVTYLKYKVEARSEIEAIRLIYENPVAPQATPFLCKDPNINNWRIVDDQDGGGRLLNVCPYHQAYAEPEFPFCKPETD